MERVRTVNRVARALVKPPQTRNSIDINYIAAETDPYPTYTRGGPGLHRDLCHVVRGLRLERGDALPVHQAVGGAGAFVVVLQGRVAIRTRARGGFDAPEGQHHQQQHQQQHQQHQQQDSEAQPGTAPEESVHAPVRSVREEDLHALFDSIDVDGSGGMWPEGVML